MKCIKTKKRLIKSYCQKLDKNSKKQTLNLEKNINALIAFWAGKSKGIKMTELIKNN